MHELEEYLEQETVAAVWIVRGAWWVVLRDDEAVLMPEGPLLLGPAPSLN